MSWSTSSWKNVKTGNADKKGWPLLVNRSYFTYKVLLAALTWFQQRYFDREFPEKEIFINGVHPDFVKTRITHGTGTLTPEEAVKGSLVACFVSKGGQPKGQFI